MDYFFLLKDRESLSYIFLSALCTYTPYTINAIVDIQYVHYMKMLENRYKVLNDYLTALIGEVKRENCKSSVWNIKQVFYWNIFSVGSNEKKKIHNIQNFTYGKFLTKRLRNISDPIYVVDTVVSLHIKLSDTAALINHAFGIQLLLLIAIAFVGTVCALFTMAINLAKSTLPKKNIDWNVVFILWVIANSIEVFAIVFSTSSLCEEVSC